MRSAVTGLDHVIIAVSDLEATVAVFRSLGFTPMPRGEHPQWGTANACLMFGRDYVELLAAQGPGEAAERVRAFTAARRNGLMAVALGSRDAAHDAQRLGLAAPSALSRSVEGQTAHFAIAALPDGSTPGMASFLCQHLTPELLRPSGSTDHANGALSLVSVTAVVEEPLAQMAAWDRMIGPAAATATDDTVTVHTPNGMVFLCRPEDLGQLHPEADEEAPPPPPALVALSLRVADTDRAARLLAANRIGFSRDGEGNIRIPAEEACGVFLELLG
ncbi:conserved hypothetical protein [Candidatus Terasakiella magnetica]|nr:conserved hypothetical protein [Candidatus Terasakiella magnetica]